MTQQAQAQAQKSKLDELTELANQAKAQRKAVPLTSFSTGTRVKAKELIETFAAKHGGQNKTRHYMCAPEKEARDWALKGYTPEHVNGEYVRNESDILYWCDADQFRERMAAPVAADRARLAAIHAKDVDKAKDTPTSSGFKVKIDEAGSPAALKAVRGSGATVIEE